MTVRCVSCVCDYVLAFMHDVGVGVVACVSEESRVLATATNSARWEWSVRVCVFVRAAV